MELTKEQVRQIWACDKRKDRKRFLVVLCITILIFVVSLCVRYRAYDYDQKFISLEYFKSLGSIASLGVIARLKITVMAVLSGAGLAIAGSVFQTIYKNPMASPNMLGATAGVNLGNILMIVLYSQLATELVITRYKLCYLMTAICVIGVLILGKVAGDRKGNPSVIEMVMAGSIISQGLNVFTQYYMYRLEDEDLLTYQELSMGTYLQIDSLSMLLFIIAMVVGLVPMILLKYRLNAVAIDAVEARTLGINPGPLRWIGQLCGILMVTAAMIHCGQIGMITLVVPYLVRMIVGADFRKVCVYSALTGASLLMVCRILTSFILIAGEEIPVTFILNIFLTPVFMVILAKQKRGIV